MRVQMTYRRVAGARVEGMTGAAKLGSELLLWTNLLVDLTSR